MQQLDYIGHEYLQNLRDTCVPPTPFFPEDPIHTKSTRFLRKERIESLFRPDDAMQEAAGILDHARAKELVESMIISRSHPRYICTALSRIGFRASEDAIARYRHFYFNVDLVDSSELKALMEARLAVNLVNPKDHSAVLAANRHEATYKSDVRRNIAMHSTPISAHITNSLRMGLMPSSADVSRLVDAVLAASLSGALDMGIRGLPAQGKDYMLMAKLSTEIIEVIGDPSDDLREGLAKLGIETDNTEVPHINQLSDGSHTLSLEPMKADEVGVDDGS